MRVRLKEARAKAGYKSINAAAAALQERLGKNCYTSLYNAERGRAIPRADFLYAVAALYGVSVEFLMAG